MQQAGRRFAIEEEFFFVDPVSGDLVCDGIEHLRSDEHVALRDIVGARAMAGPLLRARSRVLRGATFDVDDADLSRGGARISSEKTLERVGRCFTTRQRVER